MSLQGLSMTLQRLPGWLLVHHKHAFSRGGAVKGAKSLYRLVESVAMRDHLVHRHLSVDHEPRNLEEFRLTEGPRAIDGGHFENDIAVEVDRGRGAHPHVATAAKGTEALHCLRTGLWIPRGC